MGNCFSVQLQLDHHLFVCCCNWAGGQAGYISNIKDNLKALQYSKEDLMALRDDVMRKVSVQEDGRPQMKRLQTVNLWLRRVDTTITEVDVVIGDGPQEVEKLCFGGYCSRNCNSSYNFGKEVNRRLNEVNNLKKEGDFEVVAERVPAERVVEKPCDPTVGLETMVDEVWSCLMEDQVGIVGLWGMGGVGKTTLLTQIYNKFHKTSNDFRDVIWVVVSKDLRLEKIQEDIGKKIGFFDEEWKSKSLEEKAVDIYNVLRNKKFVLLLDDIWEWVDILKVGVPYPNEQNGSKMVFTTRVEEVCCQMRAKEIPMRPLAWDQAWELFQENVGRDTITMHEDIPHLAQAVARECDGLPLALITTARAMAGKKAPQEWKDALNDFRKSSSDLQGMGKVYTILKYSYDRLPNDTIRSCFSYCALFPEDFKILKDNLIDYWLCEDFWNDACNGADSRNKGYTMIGLLVRASLLEEEGQYVKMHDVIRDMALWMENKSEKMEEKMWVKAGAQLIKAPGVKNWKGVRRISLMQNSIKELSEVPECPGLSTLFLGVNRDLSRITGDFFQFMNTLTVLDLSGTGITELPVGISKLVSLQHLNLSWTDIEHLPLEIRMLEKLKCLNLEGSYRLNFIPREVICCLSWLQVLKMWACGSGFVERADNILYNSDVHVEELQLLEHLNVLSTTISSAYALHSLISTDKLSRCTQALSLYQFRGLETLNISTLENLNHLNTIAIGCSDLQELNFEFKMEGAEKTQLPGGPSESIKLKERCFNSLRQVEVRCCRYLPDLTWLVLAPNLTTLCVVDCKNMEDIISVGKMSEVRGVGEHLIPFAKLESLQLVLLPRLKSIYWDALPFRFLERIRVIDCPMLKRLPLNSNSAKGCKVSIEAEEDWRKNVEWEDDATKAIFLPYFVPWKWK